ncbi:MAG: T9SS type A sorting domain-containing protein [Salibacteraceae bacterium]
MSGKIVYKNEIDQHFEFSSDRFNNGIYMLILSNQTGDARLHKVVINN